MRVRLGPELELHDGIHGSLCDHPPPGVEYVKGACRYHFLHGRSSRYPFNPFDELAITETVDFDLDATPFDLVHSSRIPVRSGVPFLVDEDCFLSTLRYGQFFAFGSTSSILEGRVLASVVRRRERAMLSWYLRDECQAILFRTEHERSTVGRYLREHRLLEGSALERFESKLDVLYPVVPRPQWGGRSKQPSSTVVRILYAGRTHPDKGGDVALAVFARLLAKWGREVEAVYLGPGPRETIDGVKRLPFLDRRLYLELLATADVFFSPTSFENPGMALIEAAAHCLPVVTSCGSGMEHITDFFEPGRNALLVSNDLPFAERVDAYLGCLDRLVADDEGRERMSEANRTLTETGKLSVERHHRTLLGHYGRALRRKRRGRAAGERSELARLSTLNEKVIHESVLRWELAMRTEGRSKRLLLPLHPSAALSRRTWEAR